MSNQTASEEYSLTEVKIVLKEGPRVYSTEPINTPEAAVKLLASKVLNDLDRECVMVVNLNNALQPINFNVVSVGSINRSIVSIPNIFKSAITSNSYAILVTHNPARVRVDSSPVLFLILMKIVSRPCAGGWF